MRPLRCHPEPAKHGEGSVWAVLRRTTHTDPSPSSRLGMTLALLFVAAAANAQIVASTSKGVIVAHNRVIELPGAWSTEGVPTPEVVVTSKDRIAVLDPLANEARIVELATGRGTTVRTGETPVAGVFVGGVLYLLERDARALERIGADGTRASISTHADPAFLRERSGTLYVYDRAAGLVDEITTQPFAIRRTAKTSPFGSDFEIDSRNGYVVLPRSGMIATIALATMQPGGTVSVGAVPVDLDIASGGTALSASTLAIADPAMKKVWITEGAQSTGQAFLRGFLRGLIGLGLFSGRNSEFPTGIDRVYVRGGRWYAYDSSSGTLYRVAKTASRVLAKRLAPQQFAITGDGVWVWNDEVRRLQKLPGDG
jgi:hypothetical protein